MVNEITWRNKYTSYLKRKWLHALIFTFVLTNAFIYITNSQRPHPIVTDSQHLAQHRLGDNAWSAGGQWRKLSEQQKGRMSTLGRILFLDEALPRRTRKVRNYTILVWKYGRYIESRHIKHFSNTVHDPFEKCSVKNCRLTYSDSDLAAADIVIFHLHRMKGLEDLPKTRRPEQIWAFLTDESPDHTFLTAKQNISMYDGVFNWSMHYRMDADIPVPSGRTLALSHPRPDAAADKLSAWKGSKRRDRLATIMGSNCGGRNKRWAYVRELQKHIAVDVYGKCGNLTCPGHYNADCKAINDYMFYLSFENSNCDEYVTEKAWWNAYAKSAIPVVMAGRKASYDRILPPGSFVHVDDFASPKNLANYLLYLNRSDTELATYFGWKRRFGIVNEHGYFGSDSVHYCRACEGLNYNAREKKVYGDLGGYWVKDACHRNWMEE